MKPKEPLKIATNSSNKKIYFESNGKATEKVNKTVETTSLVENSESTKVKPQKKKFKKDFRKEGEELGTRWYEVHAEYNVETDEPTELKDAELKMLNEHCKKCFNEEVEQFKKNNPSDAKWLETALHKGTAKDRANAGALLIQTNPIANLPALDALIVLTKFSNKTSIDVLETVTDLFINSLLPPNRKLLSIQQRGNDWKLLKSKTIDSDVKSEIYAYWYFESDLKDRYHNYLLNLQAALQNGKEINKVKAIISTSNLLKGCPEREAFLLSILVNKFGDPDKKIASKATYHLRQILMTHPNMAQYMILETEKLIFRSNINELAQHYGIGFLSLIAPIANVQSSQKLVNICFSFFKIKIEKGDINSKTMQSILNCLRIAIQNINNFNTEKKRMEITTPDVVSTIYRLIYLSNVSIAFQALSLLLQLVLVQDEKHDRFYNALYKKITDPEIVNANNKITSLYFHIIHRSVHQDSNVPRAKAFVKRVLQMALSFPPAKACGALIVVSKILRSRPELVSMKYQQVTERKEEKGKVKFEDSEDDEEEIYKDVALDESGKEVLIEKETTGASSWIHVQHAEQQKADVESEMKKPLKYDAYKRSAAYAGAELSLYYELVLMSRYFHPTVQVFIENIVKNHNIKYYGDPLKDFGLAHFLERFAFKNPKKVDPKEEKSAFKHQSYQSKGSRGQSVFLLTEQACTEDERFIFDFMQRKREIREQKVKFSDEKQQDSDVESIDDDEFDSYLDSLGAANDYKKSERDFDYLSDMQKDGGEMTDKKSKKNKKDAAGSDSESMDEEWDDLEDDDEESGNEKELDGDESGTDQSIDEQLDDSDASLSEGGGSDDEDVKPSKKAKKLKHKGGENIFAAVEDFSEMIEKNSSNTHGTLGEIFNKDKSSQKQIDWEQKRHDKIAGFKRKKSFEKRPGGFKKKRF